MNHILNRFLTVVTATAMGGIVLLVFTNVVMRYVFNSGLTWSEEVAVNLFVWVIFLGAILAALEGLHIKVDLLTSRLPAKLQKAVLLIANTLVLLAMGVLVTGGVEVVRATHTTISSATGIPSSFISVSLVIFAVSVSVVTLYDTYKCLRS
jgi:TRAP-type C4-dicarboxylate transport system permease small subunit